MCWCAGLLWTKQFYHYIVKSWLDGDPEQPAPPAQRRSGRNAVEWKHLFNRDIISMPDKWEYPWVRREGEPLGEGEGEPLGEGKGELLGEGKGEPLGEGRARKQASLIIYIDYRKLF